MSEQAKKIEGANAVEDVWQAFVCHFDKTFVKEAELTELRKTLCIDGQKELMRRLEYRYSRRAIHSNVFITQKELNELKKKGKPTAQ